MKRTYLALGIMLASAAASSVNLDNQAQKTGYAIGADLGGNLFQFNTEEKRLVDFDAVIVGLRDAHEKRELSMSEDEMNQALMAFSKEAEAAMKKKIEDMQAEVANESKKFLEENAKKDGVVTTDSGLQYVVIEEGEGKMPVAENQVQVNYEGRLIDGTVFDSSEEPVTFGVEQVIDGWIEGIQLMKEGAKYTFFIPSELAYGDVGQPSAGILPGSALIFDVTLLKVLEDEEQENKDTAVEEATEAVDNAEASNKEMEATAEEKIEVNSETAEEITEETTEIANETVDSVETVTEEVGATVEKTTEVTTEIDSTMSNVNKVEEDSQESVEEVSVVPEESVATGAVEQSDDTIKEAAENQTDPVMNEVAKMAENAVENSEGAIEEQVSDAIEKATDN